MKIEIIPEKGIKVGEKNICFGDEKASIINMFPNATLKGESVLLFDKDLKIDFTDERVSYFEITGGKDGELEPIFNGAKKDINLFSQNADAVLDLLKEENNSRITDDDGGYSFFFDNLGITVIREQNDYEIEELKEELKDCGIDPETDEDFQYEKMLAEYFCAVGLER